MTLNFNWVTPMSPAKCGGVGENTIYAKKAKAGRRKDSGEVAYQLGLVIPERAMKAARFVVGDRVEVGFAEDSDGLIVVAVRRVIHGGYSITSARGGANAQGQAHRGKIQMTFRDGMPESFYSVDGGYSVDENGMLIAKEGK